MTSTGEFRDHYAEFELDPADSAEELGKKLDVQQRAWAGKASRAPSADKRREAEDRVAQITEARKELLDPARRTAYDTRRTQRLRAPEPKAKPQQRAGGKSLPGQQGGDAPRTRDWLEAARTEVRRGNPTAALYEAQQAVHFDDTNADAWQLLGALHLDAGDTAAAIQEFRRSITLAPRNAYSHFLMGRASRAVNDLPTAITWHLKACALEQDNTEYRIYLGDALYAAGRYDEALQHYERALTDQPEHAGLRNQISSIWSLRAEGAKTYHPFTQQRLITSAEAARRIDGIVDQALAVQPTDQELVQKLHTDQAAARYATGKTWRGRKSMFGIVLIFAIIVYALPDGGVADWTGNLLLLATLVLLVRLGWKPRWWHARKSLPPNAVQPDWSQS
ncbi:tetratricopeptide repeat protein [Streptomyces sp. RKAG337]|uniref:tetratricopeptide repeat protein n=1 Tax=Streptomyces sp. RKAG337 TaxID=2893404 RepID=UPI00203495A2|nr:tetratricopeptide repeat protein [Streptomyces sp. RKAG337]MCM2427170.1 tetratricopeptide repeat protein [Streptomyces sp. RKAG337]